MLKIAVIIGLLLFAYWVMRYMSPKNQRKVVVGLFSILGSAAIIFMGFELFR
ncbi:hypothetical protein [Photobacterium angustum]|uniref:hypothetical protein n=1 Tax=Photobacterium angustum TaxID=661 RepID=UPI0005D2F84D|nr:hypothetical protein [Photobacterium angustum]KJF80624.1 membrane protein [Photobacterium damselae subsp. damselae]KJF93605.1 membrane protein [Photobacterium angustum]KJG00633.1 membrane protein [Photobacterium angustum]KJG04697.1 membrane protein [Photobacterium angustum]KJG15843.1 membrane protein [Photobacterium angustum]